ncbi:prolipoprotein diacylglyceryl transferase family protein [Clostridium magnum]
MHNPNFIVETLNNGFVVYGGIIAGFITSYVYCKIKGLEKSNIIKS